MNKTHFKFKNGHIENLRCLYARFYLKDKIAIMNPCYDIPTLPLSYDLETKEILKQLNQANRRLFFQDTMGGFLKSTYAT